MTTQNAIFTHAELSLAAYTKLSIGRPDEALLVDTGMVGEQALNFSNRWRVVDQYNSPLTGLSATVFQEVSSSNRYVAIRGTNDLADLVEDFLNITRLGSYNFSIQFSLLSTKVREWISDGTLPGTFSVTGHSLGGFLATGLTAEFSSHVEHAYLFNSPGLDGLAGFSTAPIRRLLGLQVEIDPAKVSNVKADAGVSPIAALGLQIASPSWIAIENQLGLGVLNSPAALNHSQRVLADSIAVYSVYQALDATARIVDIGQILRRASHRNADMLEGGTFLLAKIFGQLSPPAYEDRESMYSSLDRLKTAITQGEHAGAFSIRILSDANEIYSRAGKSDAEGLAYRYALKELNPFALSGAPAVYAGHNNGGRLDVYDARDESGTLTEQWLQDRAKFLVWKNEKFEKDIADDAGVLRRDHGAESYLFTDKAIRNITGGDLSIRVVGGNVLQHADPIRFTFGSEASESLQGGKYGDHLYGEDGDDALSGGEGDDYLEGGRGNDIYEYASADDLGGSDTIFDLDGQGSIVFDGQVLSGGRKTSGNRYVSDDGRFAYVLVAGADGDSSLFINNVIEVRNFDDAELGITLSPAGPSESIEYQYHYHGYHWPIDGPEGSAQFFLGSAFNDEFQAGGDVDGEFVPGLYSASFSGKSGDDSFLGAYGWGGDTASGGAGDDSLHGSALGSELPLSDPGMIGDVLYGSAGRDVIHGSPTNDRLFGDWEHPSSIFSGPQAGSGHTIRLGSDLILYEAGSAFYWAIHDDDTYADVRRLPDLQSALFYMLGIEDDAEVAALYDDFIEGFAGDDRMVGGFGSDLMSGGDGDDVIVGDYDENVYREMTGRLDPLRTFGSYAYLLGLPGDDILDGGEGNDQLTDRIAGNDAMFGGPGDDMLWNNDRELAGLLYRDGTAPALTTALNILDGGDGDDDIVSFSPLGSDHIYGGGGNDSILFEGITPLAGDDETLPMHGAEVYVDAGEGADQVTLNAGYAEVKGGAGSDSITAIANFIHLDLSGNAPEDYDDLVLPYWASTSVLATRDGNDVILSNQLSHELAVLSGWFDDEAFKLDSIAFEDANWGPAEIEAALERGGRSTSGDDHLFIMDSGSISAGEGNDKLTAQAGPVLLDGGPGDDEFDIWGDVEGLVVGGAGNDRVWMGGIQSVISFNRGDGADTVYMKGGTISLGADIAYGDITFHDIGVGYVLDFGAGDSLTLLDIFVPPSEEEVGPLAPLHLQIVRGGQTDTYDMREIGSAPVSLSGAAMGGWLAYRYALDHSVAALPDEVVLDVLNDPAFGVQQQWAPQTTSFAPFVLGGIENQQAEVGRPFSLTVSENAFIDIDSDVLPVLSLARQNGEALPAWLRFSAQDSRLEGLPRAEDAGELSLRLTATDNDGLSVSELFTLAVGIAAAEDPEVPVASPPSAGLPVAPPGPTLPADTPAAVVPTDTRIEQSPQSNPLIDNAAEQVVAGEQMEAVTPATAVPTDTGLEQTPQLDPLIDNSAEQIVAGQQLEAALNDDHQSVDAAYFPPHSASRDHEFRPITLETVAAQIAEAADADTQEEGRAAELSKALFDEEENSSEGADTTFLEPKHLQLDLAPVALADPGTQGYGLSSWEITNALLQFHLEKSGSAADESPAFSPGVAPGMSGMGFSSERLAISSSGFTALPGQLQVFSGLQEGLRSLGEVRIT